MRTRRLKITKDNYASIKAVQNQLPKHHKGNDTIREALNISGGSWSYLRQSNTYEEFVELRRATTKSASVEQVVESPSISGTSDSYTLVRIADSIEGINETLKHIDLTLVRLCMAWENTPQKKGWLK